MKFKRNNIVMIKGCTFYGRVVKSLPSNRLLVLDCGKIFHSVTEDHLELHNDYKGYMQMHYGKGTAHFVRMTSLRKLKKNAARYHYEFAHNTPEDYQFIRVWK